MSDEAEDTPEAPGWDAIDRALWLIYGDREPHHVGTIVPYAEGGPDPIHGISVYKVDEPMLHWHFITYGFSELWEKESTDPESSGYGFELTFRLACRPEDEKPPNWALNFLQNLGRYVFETGNVFGAGHTMPLNGPIQGGSETLIHAITFAHDPQLPPINTPHGRVTFLQIVGLTMEEIEAISSWNASAFLELRSREDALLLTDLDRGSWLDNAAFAAEAARRSEEDGSSCGWLALVLECDTRSKPICVRIQTIAVSNLKRRLLGRLPYGRELTLNDREATVLFKPGEASRAQLVEDAVIITLQDDHLTELVNSLQPHAGVHRMPGVPNLVLEIVRTEITDRHGNVVEVVE